MPAMIGFDRRAPGTIFSLPSAGGIPQAIVTPDRLGGLQGGTTINLNAVDVGAAYLPQKLD